MAGQTFLLKFNTAVTRIFHSGYTISIEVGEEVALQESMDEERKLQKAIDEQIGRDARRKP